jgi:hypothetical protein
MKKAFLFGIFILMLSAIVILQVFSDREKARAIYTEPIVLKSETIRITDLGLHNAAADLLWLASIQYFGGGESRTMSKLSEYLFTATELDSQFSYPYAFGVLILPSVEKMDEALVLGQKGVDLKLADWRIPYYMATIYFINKEDNKEAAKYFDIAANTKDAPDNITQIAARFGANSNRRSQTIQIWQGIYENSDDEVVKERAKKYIIHYSILDALDQAVQIYKDKYNKLPTDISELLKIKVINQVPIDPFGFEYIIREDGKVNFK